MFLVLRDRICHATAVFTLAVSVASGCLSAAPARVHGRVTSEQSFRLEGNVSPVLQRSADQGEVDPSFVLPRITVHLSRTAAQEADLAELLAAQQDRSSRQFHKWLTPEQYASRFGLAQSDLDKITNWLAAAGFSDISVSASHSEISMTGTAAHVQNAFRTAIHQFQTRDGVRYGNADAPQLPNALKDVVLAVGGLNDVRPRPHVRLAPRFTSNLSSNHFVTPDDFATIYDLHALYNKGINGSGQKIVIAGQSDIQLSDVETFRQLSGLPANDPQIIQADSTDPGIVKDDETEAELDVEWAGAVAPGAKVIFVTAKHVYDSVDYAIQHNVGSVISMSYGDCENDLGASNASALNSEFQQANTEGITIIAAAGDGGAADCDAAGGTGSSTPPTQATHGLNVDFPASSQYVTGVGGTEFNEGSGSYWAATNNTNSGSALSYIPEQAWNNTTLDGVLAAGGGGPSKFYPKPSWQTGTGVPNDSHRDVPDLSLAASGDHDGYLICSAGWCTNGYRNASTYLDATGGTSASSPAMAGIVALINQSTGSSQGNINATLYALASIAPEAFHDVTQGNNQVPCKTGTPDCTTGTLGYAAGPGYDLATGLGSVDAANLVNDWGADFTISAAPATVSIARGSSGSVTLTVAHTGNYSAPVSLACSVSGTLTLTTCSVPPTATSTATVTISNTATSSGSPWGNNVPTLPIAGLTILAFGTLAITIKSQRKLLLRGAAAASMLALASCGGGSAPSTPSTPSVTQTMAPAPQTGTVTITAIVGTVSRTTTINVTVQ